MEATETAATRCCRPSGATLEQGGPTASCVSADGTVQRGLAGLGATRSTVPVERARCYAATRLSQRS